jgi:tRNA uridine 5-carbamoylmethylation protein Kti12
MSKLEVLVGLPGSGKSTRLSFVDDPEFGGDVFVYSTDNYIEARAKEVGKTYNDMFRDHIDAATKHMNDVLAIVVSAGIDVFWDQTNMSSKKRKSILSKFPKNYRKECWCIAPPRTPEEWAELDRRLASRPGKTIPHHIIESMADSYVEPELDEGFDYILVVDLFGNAIAEKGQSNAS